MRIFMAMLGLLATSATAEPYSYQAPSKMFGGKLLLVDEPETFWKAWEAPATPAIPTTAKVTRTKPVHAMVVFNGCRPAADGNCNVSVEFSVLAPDGSPYDRSPSSTAWSGPPGPGENLIASLKSMGFILEPKDELGRYRITATLTDNVAGTSVRFSEYVIAEAE